MECVSLQRSPAKKKPRLTTQDTCQWCIICKSVNKETAYGSEEGRSKVVQASNILNDNIFVSSEGRHDFRYHMRCYRSYILKSERAGKRKLKGTAIPGFSEKANSPESAKRNRNQRNPSAGCSAMKKCVICNMKTKYRDNILYRISEDKRAESFLHASQYFKDCVFDRTCTLVDKSSVFAADVMYHKSCMNCYIVKYEREKRRLEIDPINIAGPNIVLSFKKFLSTITWESKGYALSDLRNTFNTQFSINSEVSNKQLKSLLIAHYGEEICFSYPKERNVSQTVFLKNNVALSVLVDKVRSVDAMKNCASKLKQECEDYDFGIEGSTIDGNSLQYAKTNLETNFPREWAKFFTYLCPSYGKSEHARLKLHFLFEVFYNIIHSGRKQTPLRISVAQTIHETCRSKTLITLFNRLGICCSYDEVLKQDYILATRTISLANGHHVPIPTHIRTNVPIRCAVDNFDHDEATTSGAKGSHDTILVIFQDNSNDINSVATPLPIQDPAGSGRKSLKTILPCQEIVPYSKAKKICGVSQDFQPVCDEMPSSSEIMEDFIWNLCRFTEHQHGLQEETVMTHMPSWSSFNSLIEENSSRRTATGFTPILPHIATSYDTIYTTLMNFQSILHQLGLKTGSFWCDENVYRIAREIQFVNPQNFGNIFIGLGSFHFEKVVVSCIGNFLKRSGALELLTVTETMGTRAAEGALQGSNYSRGLRALSMLQEVIHSLLVSNFLKTQNETKYKVLFDELEDLRTATINKEEESARRLTRNIKTHCREFKEHLKTFVETRNTECKNFQFWSMYLTNIHPILRNLVQADRENNWPLYVSAVRAALPLFFAFGKVNYSRWGSVYYQDCQHLKATLPEICNQFINGGFTVRNTGRKFSSVALDQALEQNYNKPAKIAGGIIGFTRKKEAVTKHDLIKHEKLGFSNFLRKYCGFTNDDEYDLHHEFSNSTTEQDFTSVCEMIAFVKEHGNPFEMENTGNVYNIVTGKHLANEEIDSVLNCIVNGETKYQDFLKERFQEKSKSIFDPIKQIKAKTCVSPSETKKSISTDTADAQRFIDIARVRNYNIEKLFTFELTSTPWFLTKNGTLRKSDKSQLTNELEKFLKHESPMFVPQSDKSTAFIVDFMSQARKVNTKAANLKTFGDLAQHIWNLILSKCKNSSRIDIIYDQYNDGSIKEHERNRRMKCDAIQVSILTEKTKLPNNMDSLWASNSNKVELQKFFGKWLLSQKTGCTEIYMAGIIEGDKNKCVKVCTGVQEEISELYCSHEEADDRIIFHLNQTTKLSKYRKIVVISSDTDVFVLSIYHYQDTLKNNGLQELWFSCGVSKTVRTISIHTLCELMQQNTIKVLLAIHALTGCDTTSKIGTKTAALKHANAHSDLINDFGKLPINEDMIKRAEEFLLHVLGYKEKTFDAVRYKQYHMMAKFDLEKLVPTSNSLELHIKRAYLQTHMWLSAIHCKQPHLQPTEYGYVKADDHLKPNLTVIKLPADMILPCTCRKCFRKNVCPCRSSDIPCCSYCKCSSTKLCHNKIPTK